MVRLRPDGRFRIEGGARDSSFWVYLKDDAVALPARYRPGGPFVARLGAAEEAIAQAVTAVVPRGSSEVVFERVTDAPQTLADRMYPLLVSLD